jgi:hypothetical protein
MLFETYETHRTKRGRHEQSSLTTGRVLAALLAARDRPVAMLAAHIDHVSTGREDVKDA